MKFKSDRQRRAVFANLNLLNINSNRLPVQVGIIVPSTLNNRKISNIKFLKRVDAEKKFFSKTYGGDTSIKVVGGYVMPVKSKKGTKEILIKEKGSLVESSLTPAKYNQTKQELANHIKSRQKQWKQDTVFYKIEGESFIYPKKDYIAHAKTKGKISVV